MVDSIEVQEASGKAGSFPTALSLDLVEAGEKMRSSYAAAEKHDGLLDCASDRRKDSIGV